MTISTYDDLLEQMQQLFQNEQYGEALQLLTEEGQRFPQEGPTIYYLRSCMAARMGQADLALKLLEEALAKGFWYGEQVMRETPSWQGLQGTPEFERLANICRAMREETQSGPRLFTLEPEDGCSQDWPCPLFIALHGNGDNGRHALNGWRWVTTQGWLLAALQSSQIVSSDAFVWDDQDAAIREVGEHYASLIEQNQIDKERVILAGFSMGGETALRAALTGTVEVQGFILLAPGGPTIDDELEGWQSVIDRSEVTGLKGYVIRGGEDRVAGQGAIERLVALLNAHNIPCQLETLPGMRHQYPADLAPALSRALAFIAQ